MLKRARHQPEKYPWVTRLLERKPFRVLAVAVANKMARVAWALLASGGSYRAGLSIEPVSWAAQSGTPAQSDDTGLWKANAYVVKYTPNLFSNFWDTTDPVNGDQFHPHDDRFYGGAAKVIALYAPDVMHPHSAFDRYRESCPRRSELHQNCYSRDGDEQSAVPAGV